MNNLNISNLGVSVILNEIPEHVKFNNSLKELKEFVSKTLNQICNREEPNIEILHLRQPDRF